MILWAEKRGFLKGIVVGWLLAWATAGILWVIYV